MHAAFRILVKGGLSVSFIRVSDTRISNLMQRGTRRRNTTHLLAVSVRRFYLVDRIRSKHSARGNSSRI